jgi:hypothetical protein
MVRLGVFGAGVYSFLKQPFHVPRIGIFDQADAGTAWQRSMTAPGRKQPFVNGNDWPKAEPPPIATTQSKKRLLP